VSLEASTRVPVAAAPGPAPGKGMVWIPGGAFTIGSNEHYPEEAPAHEVTVDGFWIDRAPVTNLQFTKFVKETGYVTSAERAPSPDDYPGAKPELLVPASTVFSPPPHRVSLDDAYQWWDYVPGADWRHPEGPGSSLHGRERHPVVHVAFEDAEAYARWAVKELPTEPEWEYAARGGLDGAEYAWGDELAPKGKQMANTWQGNFPLENLRLDGYERTSPVGSFPPNGYGLVDMIANVWEWTVDWYRGHAEAVPPCCGVGRLEASRDPNDPAGIPRRVMKGGSHLCAPNYCRRYRPAARMAQPVDTSTSHLGFRCIVRPRPTDENRRTEER
jgi:sulfatase modifying factor 1